MDGLVWVLLLLFLPLSWLMVAAIRHWAQRRQILDVPNERSSHSRPTPRGGGIAIVAAALLTGASYLGAVRFDPVVLAYLCGGALIAGISWRDDVRSVSNLARFLCHLAGAALVLLAATLAPDGLPLAIPSLPGRWLAASVCLIWIVGLTNIYNFMDGIDGLAGSQALVTALWWFGVGIARDAPLVAALGLAVAMSALGFLVHNWSPARIFMGDVGSAFLGYTFAVLPLLMLRANGDSLPLLGGFLAIWPFVFDGVLTLARRALAGENIFRAHRSHLYQRLTISGWSHRAVSLLYSGYALISALCGAVVVAGNERWAVALLPVGIGAALFFFVGWLERGSPSRAT